MPSLPIEISARHIHLSRAHVDILFGKGYELTQLRDLSQPGQYAAKEQVDVVGSKGTLSDVRVLGPVRPESQVELSATDARSLGIPAHFRNSGDTKGTASVTLRGPKGEVRLDAGAIIALRHLHCDLAHAATLGLTDKDVISVRIGGPRAVVLENVLVRVSKDFALALHIDTDEANAAGAAPGVTGELVPRAARAAAAAR